MLQRKPIRYALHVAWFITMALVAWWFILPTTMGGRTALVTTQGNSMEPKLHAGDMVVVRRTDNSRLQVGDAVLYPSGSLHRYVLHRIIKIDASGRLTLQGDNNKFVDADHPKRSAVIGKMAFHIPGGGKIPGASSPAVAGIATGLMLLAVLATLFKHVGRKRGDEDDDAATTPDQQPARSARPVASQSGAARIGSYEVSSSLRLGAAIALGLISIGGATWLAMRSSHLPASNTPAAASSGTSGTAAALRHVGKFSYTAREPNAAIQRDHRISTGEAVFTRSAKVVNVAFDYHLDGAGADAAAGTAALDMGVEDDNGWKMTQQLATAPVTGGVAHLKSTINLVELRAHLKAFERASQTTSPIYRVRLRPHVKLDKQAPKEAAGSSFDPMLALVLDPVRLRPETITGGDVMEQYSPSEPIAEAGKAGSPPAASAGLRSKITRPVAYGLSALGLLLGLGAAAALGAGSIVPAPEREDDGEAPPISSYSVGHDDTEVIHVATTPRQELPRESETAEIELEQLTPVPAAAAAAEVPAPAPAPEPRAADTTRVSPRAQLDRAGIFYLPTVRVVLDTLPLMEVHDVDELVALARVAQQPVLVQRIGATERWIVRTGDSCCIYTADAPASAAAGVDARRDDWDTLDPRGWVA